MTAVRPVLEQGAMMQNEWRRGGAKNTPRRLQQDQAAGGARDCAAAQIASGRGDWKNKSG